MPLVRPLGLLGLALAACTDTSKPGGDTTSTADAPVFEDPDGVALEVGEDAVVRFAGGRELRLAFGFVDELEERFNYDPWNLYDPEQADAIPDGLEFAEAVEAAWDGDAFALTLENGETARLTIDEGGPGLRLVFTQASGARAPYARAHVAVSGEEAFYGLGEWFDGVEHRGHVHPMQFEAELEQESGYNEAHVPIPLLISSDGWGLLADSRRPGVFDVAATASDAVDVVFDQVDGLTLDLYAPGTPRDVLVRYHRRTGMPEVPPDWAFAPLQWRDDDIHAEDLLADATALRALGIPTGCVWIDNPWQTLYNSMTPDPARFPDWEGLMDTLEGQGFRMLAWTTPYVEEADPEHDAWADAGWFVDAPILFSDFGDLVDLTHPDAMAAWQARATAAQEDRILGWKLDYGEDIQLGFGAAALAYPFANGEDERTMHHDYVRYYHRAYGEPSGGDTFLLGRTGVLGGHTITDAIWPGDLDSDFRAYGEDGHVGGLKAAIRGGTGLAASGYPFYASDTGGYRHDRPTHEVMVRWTEYSATLPIMQYGGSGDNHNPWDFATYGESVFTEETLEAFTRYAVLHTRLFPYFRELALRAEAEGLPVVMAQGFAHPEAGVHADEAFLVGEDLFVSPVEDAGATEKAVTFPPGGWVHWWTGERYEGTATVPAPVGVGPLFQREGSAIPMLRRTVQTLAATDGSVDSWADDPGRLNARVVPGEGAGFALATGEALAWADDALALTPGTLYAGWDLEVWAPNGVSAVEADGVALPEGAEGCVGCWSASDGWVRVVVDDASVVTVR